MSGNTGCLQSVRTLLKEIPLTLRGYVLEERNNFMEFRSMYETTM